MPTMTEARAALETKAEFEVVKDENNQIVSCTYNKQTFANPKYLGAGSYGDAYKLISTSGESVVIKTITVRRCYKSNEEATKEFINILPKLYEDFCRDAKREAYLNQRQDNQIGAYKIGACDFNKWTWNAKTNVASISLNIDILSKFKPGMELFDFAKSLDPTQKSDCYAVIKAILEAVGALPFVHCDLSNANIIVNKNSELNTWTAYIIDNEFAVEVEEKEKEKDENIKIYRHKFHETESKTRPPELLVKNPSDRKPTRATDIWSLGYMFRMCFAKVDLGLNTVFQNMMHTDPAKRPSFKDVIEVVKIEEEQEAIKAAQEAIKAEQEAKALAERLKLDALEPRAKADVLEKKIDKENLYEWIYFRALLKLDSESAYKEYDRLIELCEQYNYGYTIDYKEKAFDLLNQINDLRKFLIEIFTNFAKQFKNIGADTPAIEQWCAAQCAMHYFETCENIDINKGIAKFLNAHESGIQYIYESLNHDTDNSGKKLFVKILPHQGIHFLQNFKDFIPALFGKIRDAQFKIDLLKFMLAEHKRALALCLSFGVFSDSVKLQIAAINQILKGESLNAEDADKAGLADAHQQLQQCEAELSDQRAVVISGLGLA